MFAKTRFKVNFLLIQKKVFRSTGLCFLSLVPGLVVFYVLLADSLAMAINFFLFLFPYTFLFLSGDMMKDEIESGVLENIMFLQGEYRAYLLQKILALTILALLPYAAIFSMLVMAGLLKGNFSWIYLLQFLAGLVVGIYYVTLGSWLSFYFRGGSNVLIIIMAQIMAILSLFFSLQKKIGFLDYLEKGHFPNLLYKIKFIIFTLALPNVLIARKFFPYLFVLVMATGFFLFRQWRRIKNLELKKQ
jgi:hypothetical protein